jgi:hypothetical protein
MMRKGVSGLRYSSMACVISSVAFNIQAQDGANLLAGLLKKRSFIINSGNVDQAPKSAVNQNDIELFRTEARAQQGRSGRRHA